MILIATATGKIGSELARLVLATRKSVRLAAHSPQKANQLFPQAETVPFDFDDAASVKAALPGVEQIFLAAPSDHFPAELIHQFIDQAKAAHVNHIVLLSALGVDLDESELKTENYLKASDLPWTILRPSSFMQNYATMMADTIRNQQVIVEPADDARTSFIDTRDVAASACQVLLNPLPHIGQTYTLTGRQAHNRAEVASAIGIAMGKPIQYINLPEHTFHSLLSEQKMPLMLVERLISFYRMIRTEHLATVTDHVEKLTGRPPISFEQFAQDNRQAWL